jgi:hypothetical protein
LRGSEQLITGYFSLIQVNTGFPQKKGGRKNAFRPFFDQCADCNRGSSSLIKANQTNFAFSAAVA